MSMKLKQMIVLRFAAQPAAHIGVPDLVSSLFCYLILRLIRIDTWFIGCLAPLSNAICDGLFLKSCEVFVVGNKVGYGRHCERRKTGSIEWFLESHHHVACACFKL